MTSRLERWAEPVIGAVLLLVCSNGVLFYTSRSLFDLTVGFESRSIRWPFVTVAVCAVALVASRLIRAGAAEIRDAHAGRAGVVAAFAALAYVSRWWSLIPEMTESRALVYMGLAAMSWWLALLPMSRLVETVALFAGLGVALSVLVLILDRASGVDETGAWRGVFTGRNSLAPVCALGILAGSMLLRRTGAARLSGAALAGGSVILLVGSGNRTAVLGLMVAVVVATATQWAGRRSRSHELSWTRAAATVSIASVGAMVVLVSVATRTSSFRTRQLIWELSWAQVRERPLLGHGFWVFWNDPVSTRPFYARLGSPFGSAHNSGLETALGLGFVGLTLFLVIVAMAMSSQLRWAWSSDDANRWFGLALAVLLLVEHLVESFVLWYSYNWVLLCALAIGGFKTGRTIVSTDAVPQRAGS